MADIATFGFAWDVDIDWSDTGLYNHALSDVSATWLRASFEQGTARRSNPQRPTIVTGRGTITLIGNNYVPGLSTRLTAAQLQARHLIRFRLGTALLFDGYVQEARHLEGTGDGGIFTEFQVEGLLERRGRAALELTQAATSTTTTAAAVLQQLRETYGVAAGDFEQNIQSTPLADYTFEGPVQQYASQFGQVAGGLMVARPGGELALIDPTRLPSPVPRVFRGTDYMVLGATTEFDQEQLWNKALIQYDGPETPGSGTGTGSVTDPGAGGASGVTTDLTIANPADGVKVEDMAAVLTVGAATAQWREVLGDPGSGNASGTVTDPGQSDLRGVDTNLTLNDPATGHVIEELDATLTVGAATAQWREVEGDPGSGTGAGTVTDPGAFGASGVRTSLAIANPDANHRIEEMAATFTVGAATASYTIDDRDLSANASVDRSRWSGTPVSIVGRLSTNVTLGDTERITNVSASAVVTAPFPNQGTITGTAIELGDVSVIGGKLSVDYEMLNPIVFGSRRSWGGLTLLGDAYLIATTSPNGTFAWVRDITGQGARRVASNVTMTVTVTFSYTVHDSATYPLPAPTRRTAPSWEVERVGRSQDPNNRNQSLARVTLVGTDAPGTWRINDSGTNVDVSSWEHSTGGKTYRLGGIAVSFAISWKLRDTRTHTVTPSRLQAPSWEVERVSRSTDPTNRNRKFVRVTVANAHEPGRWRINDGTNSVDLSGWSDTANRREYRITGIAVSFAVTWRTRDTRTHTVTPTRRTAPNWDVDRVGLTDNPANANNRLVRVTLVGTNSPGTWRINDGTHTVDLTTWERTANRREYKLLTIAVSFAVTWILDDENVYTLEAQNDDSITEWGERTLMFPVWFRRTATAALQSRINALAVPRNIHVVDFSLDQSTPARQGHVVGLQPGEFMGLVLDDPRTRTEISAWCFVMNMRYDLHRNRPPVKRLTLLTVGTTTPTDSATAPGRPAAPMVSADSFTSLEARWSPPASDGGRGIRSYSLRYKESSGSSWTTVGGLNALEYRITGLTSGTQYDVQVRAVNAIGASQWSPSGQATTQREPIAPARPAAPTWSNVAATTATLTWVAPNNNGAAITSYDLRYRATGTAAWTTDAGLQGLSRDLTGLMESTQYEAQVRARNRVGVSQWSASRTATTPVAPRSGSGEPIQVALTLDEARWALTVVAAGEPIAMTAALADATGAALLETGAGERIDVSAALPDASGNVLTFGTGAPIAASAALEDDAEGAVTYFGTGEPIAASAALEDDATGDVLLETGAGEPIDATVALPDATGRDIKPYPAPENARERTRLPFGNLVQVTFEWDAPTEAARQGDLWQYEYQTRVGTGNWSSSSTVGSTTLVSGSSTFTENEEYEFRVRAVYVFNAQFFRSDWATYSSSVEPTSAAGEPIAVSVTLPDGGGAAILLMGDGEPIQVTVTLTEAREPVTGLPPYALTLNSLPLTLNDHVLTLPPPSD